MTKIYGINNFSMKKSLSTITLIVKTKIQNHSYLIFFFNLRPPDLDCSDILERDFKVNGSDPQRFDVNNDDIGCESTE